MDATWRDFASNFAGIFTPVLLGIMLDKTGSHALQLLAIGLVAVAGAINYLLVMPKIAPLRVHTSAAVARSGDVLGGHDQGVREQG
ncbi:hypothetical protein [Saccharopolyspora phatthalungensis]|uniref:Major facilitator superfamily (MFS) profile domain-containing protein n=1 Tax=Saccharopolyspora phatthalungensis TaxID=664693 RepID=A0A840Q8P1_9PSEU|nr:hypothetical protein [Saccharopolyspora phatthalungensis]MBB5157114.1 hypothetical protein [Saccharopolyspora phatthalungensis]